MSGYVAKSDVLSVTRILQSKMDNSGARALENVISSVRDMVEADVVPVVHGHWVEYPACLIYEDALTSDHIACSACEKVFSTVDDCTENFNFCPWCGAKMDQEVI